MHFYSYMYIFLMICTCPFENKDYKEFSFESLQNQTNPGETQFWDIVSL